LYNLGLNDINTNIVIPYDSDILIPINQLILAKESLLKGNDYCYPFNQNYIDISKRLPQQRLNLLKTYNFDEYKKEATEYTKNLLNSGIRRGPPGLIRNCPPGGCIFIKKEIYIEMGMENEEFCGYGPEDVERKNRLRKLGYSGDSIFGDLFHIEHDHLDNDRRISTKNNNEVFSKVELMNRDEVILYYKEKNKK
jgi:predicted glycosyltransferase involved in capsule biosynthesis